MPLFNLVLDRSRAVFTLSSVFYRSPLHNPKHSFKILASLYSRNFLAINSCLVWLKCPSSWLSMRESKPVFFKALYCLLQFPATLSTRVMWPILDSTWRQCLFIKMSTIWLREKWLISRTSSSSSFLLTIFWASTEALLNLKFTSESLLRL